jgi:hypothetical protein
MSRAKTASRKKMSPELKNPQEQSAPSHADKKKNADEKNGSEKSQSSKSGSDKFGYDNLARQTLDLWREQLAHFLNNPDAMKDMNKVMEPAAKFMSPQISQIFTPLFSNGMDLWLMMLEQLGKAANMNTRGAGDKPDDQKTANSTKADQGRAENRSSAASALSGASAYAVAQLASRLADLEKRFTEFEGTGSRVAKKPAAKKKTTPSVVAAVKRAKQNQR